MRATAKPTFAAIIREHGPFIRRALVQLGVTGRDLADVEQEVFRGIDRGLPSFDPALAEHSPGALRGWLFGICARQAANHRRVELRRGEVLLPTEDLDLTTSDTPDVEERLIDAERKALLLDLLATLDPERRAVIVAYELEGLPMQDVAAALAIPVNTAWNRLRLARGDLRTAWRRIAAARGCPDVSLAVVLAPPCGLDVAMRSAFRRAARAALSPSWVAVAGVGLLLAGGFAGASAHALAASMKHRWNAPVSMPRAPEKGTLAVAAPPSLPDAPIPASLSSVGVSGSTGSAGSSSFGGAASSTIATSSLPPARRAPSATLPPNATSLPLTTPAPGDAQQSLPRARPAANVAFRREVQRIAEAQAALEDGNPAAARRALEAHERLFARGRLVHAREVLMVQLLVAEGRPREAKKQARQFLNADPSSALRAALEAVVGKLD